MNVLAIGAHYDDIELGCAGTLIKHARAGDRVRMLVVTDSAFSNPEGVTIRDAETALREGRAAAGIIGAELVCLDYATLAVQEDEALCATILRHVEELGADTVYSHWSHDLHRDHRRTARAALMAGRHVRRFLMYRSNWYDTDRAFRGNVYSDISDVYDDKRRVVLAHESEMSRTGTRWLDYFTNQNANDGRKVGVAYAECFEPVRCLLPWPPGSPGREGA